MHAYIPIFKAGTHTEFEKNKYINKLFSQPYGFRGYVTQIINVPCKRPAQQNVLTKGFLLFTGSKLSSWNVKREISGLSRKGADNLWWRMVEIPGSEQCRLNTKTHALPHVFTFLSGTRRPTLTEYVC